MALVVLVGLPGTGKSSLGRALAHHLDVDFLDTDEMLGEDPAALLRREGENSFRERELEALSQALTTAGVVATGGGVVSTSRGRELLTSAPCVWLRAPVDVLIERVGEGDRPLLDGDPLTRLGELAAQRDSLYEGVARAQIDASGTFAETLEQLAGLVGEWASCA